MAEPHDGWTRQTACRHLPATAEPIEMGSSENIVPFKKTKQKTLSRQVFPLCVNDTWLDAASSFYILYTPLLLLQREQRHLRQGGGQRDFFPLQALESPVSFKVRSPVPLSPVTDNVKRLTVVLITSWQRLWLALFCHFLLLYTFIFSICISCKPPAEQRDDGVCLSRNVSLPT